MVLSVCSKVFNLAETWEMRPEGTNPCRKIERYRENHRERFLSGEELARLSAGPRTAAARRLPPPSGGVSLMWIKLRSRESTTFLAHHF
jgi:hypothetical protein